MRLVALALLLPLPASAQEVSALDPPSVVAALLAQGHKARLITTDDGFPAVEARTPGAVNYYVDFYGCDGGTKCVDLSFNAGYSLDGYTVEDANAFNAAWVFGRVSVADDGRVTVNLPILTGHLLPAEAFADAIGLWESVLADFEASLPR